MEENRPRMEASCALFVCRVCRTKTLWPHQQWCSLVRLVEPTCADCHYWSAAKKMCGHPSHKKDGDAP